MATLKCSTPIRAYIRIEAKARNISQRQMTDLMLYFAMGYMEIAKHNGIRLLDTTQAQTRPDQPASTTGSPDVFHVEYDDTDSHSVKVDVNYSTRPERKR